MLRPFLKTGHCSSRAHCATCLTDPAWRAEVGAPEVCPHGVTLEDLPPVVNPSRLANKRLTFCNLCGDTDCGIKNVTVCRQKAILGREGFHCPQGRF